MTGSFITPYRPANLFRQKRTSFSALTAATGARLLFLSSKSPDFNPIEKAFTRFEVMLRTAGEFTVANL